MLRLLGLFAILMVLASTAYATANFSPDKFQEAQKNGDRILLHFHADWCPTCRAQKKTLTKLERKGELKGIDLITVDYDNETQLKKDMKVTAQATFIAFYGSVETGRVTGITSEKELSAFINKSLAPMSLNDQLTMMHNAMAKRIPADKKRLLDNATEKLRTSHLTEHALQVGRNMPNFSLPDAHGKVVSLRELLKGGPVIVTFYRGSWCPYCNAQLNSYQRYLPEFKKMKAQLIAITPEKPDLTVLTEERKHLTFPVLTDKNNKFATQLGLVFGVPPELKKLYLQFGTDLEKSQGNPDWQLPIPATYIVSPASKVTYAFLDVDYTHRADPRDILKALGQH